LYLHLGIGRGIEHNGHQRFLFNVYKRFLFLSRFLRFLTFFISFITFLHLYVQQLTSQEHMFIFIHRKR